mmetsp:Transcript_59384/g.172081  ORF Transcript_59384/g.172081 Transcript_59384/m.172081 type:complete len:223 (+) Transcript_59384:410-1078(+)
MLPVPLWSMAAKNASKLLWYSCRLLMMADATSSGFFCVVSIARVQKTAVTTLSTAKYTKLMCATATQDMTNDNFCKGNKGSRQLTPSAMLWNKVINVVSKEHQYSHKSLLTPPSTPSSMASTALCVIIVPTMYVIMKSRTSDQNKDFKVAAMEKTNVRNGEIKRMIRLKRIVLMSLVTRMARIIRIWPNALDLPVPSSAFNSKLATSTNTSNITVMTITRSK